MNFRRRGLYLVTVIRWYSAIRPKKSPIFAFAIFAIICRHRKNISAWRKTKWFISENCFIWEPSEVLTNHEFLRYSSLRGMIMTKLISSVFFLLDEINMSVLLYRVIEYLTEVSQITWTTYGRSNGVWHCHLRAPLTVTKFECVQIGRQTTMKVPSVYPLLLLSTLLQFITTSAHGRTPDRTSFKPSLPNSRIGEQFL